MIIKTPKRSDEKEQAVTDESVFNDRRSVLKSMGFIGAGSLLASAGSANAFSLFGKDDKAKPFETQPLEFAKPEQYQISEQLTPENKVTQYNNFYEFGVDKGDPYQHAQEFSVDPWKLVIDGEVESPVTLDYNDLHSMFDIEERIYRLRCVEAWSMVVPWLGFPLYKLLEKAKPLSSAKYVSFRTVFSPKQMRGQNSRFVGGGVKYPYREGLRMDEAMHPLTLMAVGVYGKTLPPQNGAPIRLVVPWKYGFKSIKSLVRIELTSKEPKTSWSMLAPDEYGFYANVNPSVAHPRWSQASERRITTGGLFSQKRIKTQPFNGYTEVADLYKNMDLAKFY